MDYFKKMEDPKNARSQKWATSKIDDFKKVQNGLLRKKI